MKKSNLPFKKLSVDRSPIVFQVFDRSSLAGICMASICATSICVTSACNIAKPSTPSIVGSESKLSHAIVPHEIKQIWINLAAAGAVPTSRLRFSASSCANQHFVFGSSLEVLGQSYDLTFEEGGEQLVTARAEDSETKLSGLEITKEIQDAICLAQKAAGKEPLFGNILRIDPQHLASLQNTIVAAMKKLVPDCTAIVLGAKEAECQLDSLQPREAIAATDEFQKVMIQKWSRQPYILARRSGVVTTLAKIADSPANDQNYAKFCNVLKYSIPEELPIIMTSLRWQQALCGGQSQIRRDASLYGLRKGIQELALLRDLYEQTSTVGTLTIKIPQSTIPGGLTNVVRQPLRITIAPDEAVSNTLMAEAKKYLGRPVQEKIPPRLVKSKVSSASRRMAALAAAQSNGVLNVPEQAEMCWHPVFSASLDLLRIADGMKLTGKNFTLECGFSYDHNTLAGTEAAPLSKYLIQSLSSETEFVIDNGQSKLLRLPQGQYKYTVHVLPANPLDAEEEDEKNAPKSSGELGWGSARRQAIKAW